MAFPRPESHGTPIFVAFWGTRLKQANTPTEQKISQMVFSANFMGSRVHVGCIKRRDGCKTWSTWFKDMIYLSLRMACLKHLIYRPKTPAQLFFVCLKKSCLNTWSTTFSLPVFIFLLLLFFCSHFLFFVFLFFLFFLFFIDSCFASFTVKQNKEEKNRKIAEQEPFWQK